MEQYYFISFESTNYAISAEDFLKKNNYNITVIPTPREVTQSCGLSVKLNSGGVDEVKNFVFRGDIKIKGIYCMIKENGVRRVEKVG